MNVNDGELRILSLSKEDVRLACEVLRSFGIAPTVSLLQAFTLGRVQGLAEAMDDYDIKSGFSKDLQ